MIYSVMRPNWRVFKVLRCRDSYRNTSPHIMRRIWPALAAEQIENGHKGALQVLIQGAPWIKAWSAWKAPLCPCSIFCSSHFLLSISPWILTIRRGNCSDPTKYITDDKKWELLKTALILRSPLGPELLLRFWVTTRATVSLRPSLLVQVPYKCKYNFT